VEQSSSRVAQRQNKTHLSRQTIYTPRRTKPQKRAV
jgi:hypothetical protein